MKTLNASLALAGTMLAALIASSAASPAQAHLPESELSESAVPGSQDETIYRPICWMDDGYERWLRCAAASHNHFNGGPYGPARTRRY